MLITRRSMFTGKESTRDVNCTPAQLNAWLNGAKVQYALPDASVDDREFVLSGITPEEWDHAFSSNEV